MKKICKTCKHWEESNCTCTNSDCVHYHTPYEAKFNCTDWFINPAFDREKIRKICGRCVYWHKESTKCICGSSQWYETKCPDVFSCTHWLSPSKFSVKDVTQKQLRTIIDQKKTIGSLRNANKNLKQTIEQIKHAVEINKNMEEDLAYANERRKMWKMMNKELFRLIRGNDDG